MKPVVHTGKIYLEVVNKDMDVLVGVSFFTEDLSNNVILGRAITQLMREAQLNGLDMNELQVVVVDSTLH